MAYKRRDKEISEMVDEEVPSLDGGIEEADFSNRGGKGGWGKMIIIALVVIVVFVGGWYGLTRYTNLSLPGGEMLGLNTSASGGWQAVFLTNGQVYFGKIIKTSDRELVLNNIYYIQVVEKPLQMTQEGDTTSGQQQELTLFKLGNELHGPQDEMVINRDHIMLTEKLKDDSRVVEAIN